MKKIFINVIKLIITGLIFYFILKDHDIASIFSRITNARPIYFLLAVLSFFILMLIFAFRWKLINRIFNVDRPIKELFKHHMIGLFFSNLLPSSIGGDIWRIKYLKDYTSSKSIAFIIPVLERLSGMTSILLLGILSFFYFASILELNMIYTSAFILSLLIILILLFTKKSYEFILDILSKYKNKKIIEKLIKLVETLSVIHAHKKTFIIAAFLSLSSQVFLGISSVFLAVSLNIHLELWQIMLIIPIIYFISIIPLTINGYGLKETAFIELFLLFGLTKASEAIPLTFLISFVQIIVSLAGGLFFLFYKKEGKSLYEN